MDTSEVTWHGRPEPTQYDRDRHAKMKLRPIGYGYFSVNRSLPEALLCELCKQEVENPVRFINKKPYHRECYLKVCDK